MTYVVTEECIQCKHTDCVDVCPVECFHEGANFLVIDPEECIDCGACVPECPVGAIKQAEDLKGEEVMFAQLNIDMAKIWPLIFETKAALPEAEKWEKKEGKLAELIR